MTFGCSSSETRTNVNFCCSLGHGCSCITEPPPKPSISILLDRSLIQVLVAKMMIFLSRISGFISGFGYSSTSISSFYSGSFYSNSFYSGSLTSRSFCSNSLCSYSFCSGFFCTVWSSLIIWNPIICSDAFTVKFLDTSKPSAARFFLPLISAFIPSS